MRKNRRMERLAAQAAELVVALAIEEAVSVTQRRNGGQDVSGAALAVVGLLVTAGHLGDVAEAAATVRKGGH